MTTDAARNSPLAAWLRIEEAYLNVQLDLHLPQVEVLCWKILDEVQPEVDLKADQHQVGRSRARRRRTVQPGLASRGSAKAGFRRAARTTGVCHVDEHRRSAQRLAGTVDRLLKYIDAGIVAAATVRLCGGRRGFNY